MSLGKNKIFKIFWRNNTNISDTHFFIKYYYESYIYQDLTVVYRIYPEETRMLREKKNNNEPNA